MRLRRVAATGAAIFGLIPLVLTWSWAVLTPAAGPWRGQIVDAETGAPLADVVVVAAWFLLSPGIHAGWHFHVAQEVVSDAAGRFELPARRVRTWIPFTGIRGPILHMLKPGYGQWGFRLPPMANPRDAVVMRELVDDAWMRLERDGAVIEMPPVRSREQRIGIHGDPPMVPGCHVPRWMAASNAERQALGMSPFPTERC